MPSDWWHKQKFRGYQGKPITDYPPLIIPSYTVFNLDLICLVKGVTTLQASLSQSTANNGGCWWPGNARCQGISSNGIDPMCMDYSGFNTRGLMANVPIYMIYIYIYIYIYIMIKKLYCWWLDNSNHFDEKKYTCKPTVNFFMSTKKYLPSHFVCWKTKFQNWQKCEV